MSRLKIWIVISIVFFAFYGCAVKTKTVVYRPEPKIDMETGQKVEHILKRVREIALKHDLEYLGRNTMNESVELMDIGSVVSPFVVRKLKQARNWRFRYWLVDILGYIVSNDNVIPLIEIIEDDSEKKEVRLRACESIKELRYPSAVKHLVISKDIVDDNDIKKKIKDTIDYIR
ncbi:MAG: HEAT repeat domain-containing protein [Elusimicrobiota bacterium]